MLGVICHPKPVADNKSFFVVIDLFCQRHHQPPDSDPHVLLRRGKLSRRLGRTFDAVSA